MQNSFEVQIVKKGTDTLRPDAAFWVLSYELLARDAKGTQKFQQRPDGSPHQFVIADESHNIKDWKAERTKALVPLLRKAKRSILLSGTPTRNSAEELHPQLCGLVPNMAASFCEFRARYCKLQQRNVFGGRQVTCTSCLVPSRSTGTVELRFLCTFLQGHLNCIAASSKSASHIFR